jgi:hypothetical protein
MHSPVLLLRLKPDVDASWARPSIVGKWRSTIFRIAAARIAPATETERRERVTKRALEQENSRNRLRDLKRARERESKHFVNVPLDYDTKKRLERAAYENDLKMTVIMKAAIDQYLRDNGY